MASTCNARSRVGHMSLPLTAVVESDGSSPATLTTDAYVPCLSRSSTFLRPFARRALPRFIARMDALTPERRFFVPTLTGNERRPVRPGLLASWIKPSDHSVSNHPSPSHGTEFDFVPRAYRRVSALASRTHLSRVPHGVIWASPFPSRLTTTTGRNEFVILRTSRSPPVSLHPASQRRSYVRLQSSNPNLDEDLHLVDSIHSQAH
jgi:hypothetical protein